MKKLIAVAAFAALLAGCSEKPTEAQLFGYRGNDLSDPDDMMYFTTGPGVTNWVPARALSVLEKYEYSADELAVVKAAGVIQPAKSLEKIPEGYAEKAKEPWFVTWTRDTEAFGKAGTCGFISHWNEVQKVWETGETYFSTYYDSEAEAVKALGELELAIAKFNPKKFHKFPNCWIAEYLRLRVMGLAGRRPDGKWTCMLDIQDKCESGCGQWEPVAAQQERVDEIAFRAEMNAWKAAVDKTAAANHAAVLAKAKTYGLPLFGEAVKPQSAGDGRMVYVTGGTFSPSNAVRQAIWDEKAAEMEKASGVRLSAVTKQDMDDSFAVWYATGTNKLFTVRLDMGFPKSPTNAVESLDVPGEWRGLCFENILPGNEPPPAPQRKRR